MFRRRTLALALCCSALSLVSAAVSPTQGSDTCLAVVIKELAKGSGNNFAYITISKQPLAIKPGDKLTYKIYLDPQNPEAKGGIDIAFEGEGDDLRDVGVFDDQGYRAHGDAVLPPAKGKWYTRRIALDKVAGRTTRAWNVQFEGDRDGTYVQFLDDIAVEHADGTKTVIYESGLPALRQIVNRNGYSQTADIAAVETALVAKDPEAAAAKAAKLGLKFRSLAKAREDIEFARKFLERNPDRHLEAHINEAIELLNQVELKDGSPEEIQKALHAAKHALSHTHPVMQQYTGHLVGHAHIDLQWLWEWQEGIIATHDTFRQAVKFMDEFPGFTFSQSSSCLYQTIEENYPQLFKDIQRKVKKGQWELVGGRVCEGDTNMISPESHVRHYLYGQRYFRERFGKTAKVSWEPDTFGHAPQMPQIAKLGGTDSYYFCRGGKGKPLFWWEAPDSTRLLTFEEPATGSWYNSDLSYKQFQELLDFEKVTGSAKDTLWVYGVGNHGGGPTREYIEEALSWMKDPSKPRVKFSTATQFFDKLKTYDLSKIPTIKDELNPVFEGCYTTQSEVKQLNRLAEYTTLSAEALCTVASDFGFAYPGKQFRTNWETIAFHHHHDTLPGSGIHPAYTRTKTQLKKVILDAEEVTTRALETLSLRVTPKQGGLSVMVFNPTGWKRSGWVPTYLVTSGWSGNSVDTNSAVAEAPDGKQFPVEVLDRQSNAARFWAGDIPAYGYRVFHIKKAPKTASVTQARDVLENEYLKATIEPSSGSIRSLIDKATGKELVAAGGSLGRIEEHLEKPNGMSAWVIDTITQRRTLVPTSRLADGTFVYRSPAHNQPGKETEVFVRFTLAPGERQVGVDVRTNWEHVGSGDRPHPLIRLAGDVAPATAGGPAEVTYDTPFAAWKRKNNGSEQPMLNWLDLGDRAQGLTVLNNAKSGASADGNTFRITLIRSAFTPDPKPDTGSHHWQFAFRPRVSALDPALAARVGTEFQQPLLPVTVPYDAKGTSPLEYSPLSLSNPSWVPTGLKKAEDGQEWILRFYSADSAPSTGSLNFSGTLKRLDEVNFIEDRVRALTPGDPIKLRPHQILTLKLKH